MAAEVMSSSQKGTGEGLSSGQSVEDKTARMLALEDKLAVKLATIVEQMQAEFDAESTADVARLNAAHAEAIALQQSEYAAAVAGKEAELESAAAAFGDQRSQMQLARGQEEAQLRLQAQQQEQAHMQAMATRDEADAAAAHATADLLKESKDEGEQALAQAATEHEGAMLAMQAQTQSAMVALVEQQQRARAEWALQQEAESRADQALLEQMLLAHDQEKAERDALWAARLADQQQGDAAAHAQAMEEQVEAMAGQAKAAMEHIGSEWLARFTALENKSMEQRRVGLLQKLKRENVGLAAKLRESRELAAGLHRRLAADSGGGSHSHRGGGRGGSSGGCCGGGGGNGGSSSVVRATTAAGAAEDAQAWTDVGEQAVAVAPEPESHGGVAAAVAGWLLPQTRVVVAVAGPATPAATPITTKGKLSGQPASRSAGALGTRVLREPVVPSAVSARQRSALAGKAPAKASAPAAGNKENCENTAHQVLLDATGASS